MEEDKIRTEATIEQKFHKISEFKENESRFSKEVPIGETLWKFSIDSKSNFLAVYIYCTHEKNLEITWSCYAFCKISIINMNRAATFSKHFNHEFPEKGWGYSEFMSWDTLLNPKEGFIDNDSITIEAYVNTDPNTIELRTKFGYLGLRENGSNNLLNCLLHILFFTKPLRKAIFQIPVSSDTSEKSVVLELQRIFYEVQFGTELGDATKLIESFDEKLKHYLFTENSSEFIRELLSILDSKTKGTCVEGTIPQLFQARKISSITCINKVQYKINEEVCHDIQVDTGKSKNIHEALRLDIKSNESVGEKTSKDNRLKIAEGMFKFQVLPPFLHFHLNRCHRTGGYRKKYHGLFEFSNKLCLDDYLQEPDTSDPANYTLLAVLVHSGSHIGGHYSLYIQGSCWHKLDCHPISACIETEAIDANFGLEDYDESVNLSSSACMLVYRRDSVPCPKIFGKMYQYKIPPHLRDFLNAHSFITVNVILEDSFKDHQGNDLFDEQKTEYRVFRMKKDATIEYLIKEISNKLEQSPEKMRLWPFSVRSNQTCRPSFLDIENVSNKTIFDVVGNEKYWNIFLELPSEDSTTDLQEFDKMTDVLLFFKMYDPKLKKVQYSGHSYLPDNSKVTELIQILNKKAGFQQETELELYEEIGPNNVEKIVNHSEYLKKVLNELVYSSIIVFEKKEETKLSDLPTCVYYFKDLFYRIEVSFIDKNNPNDRGFKMKLSRKTSFDQLIWTVANKIDADPYSLIFFEFQRDEATPDTHIKNDYEGTLEDLLDLAKSKIPYTLVYKKMESNSKKVSQKKKFNFLYLSSKLKIEKNFALYFEENDTLADFLETIKKYIQATEGIKGPLRLMDSNCNKVTISPKHKTSKNNEIENIWRIEDADDLEDELLICCIKFHAEIFSTFDTPFLVKIKQGEPFANVRERIRKKLSVSEKDWKKFKVAIMHMGEVNVIDYIMNFSDFILPRDSSETFDYYISIVEDLSNNVEENNDMETSKCESCKLAVAQDELKCFQCSRIFHFHCAKDAMKCCREMDSFKSDAFKIAREPHEDISMNIVPESESRISFLQENIYFLKNEISILKNELQEKDYISYREKLSPATGESLPVEDNTEITTTRRGIPRNYEL